MIAEEPIKVQDLRMRYGSTDVLHGVDFTLRRGEVVTPLGPNGAGKTTIIEILEGFRIRSAGAARVLGTDPATGGEDWRARVVHRLSDLAVPHGMVGYLVAKIVPIALTTAATLAIILGAGLFLVPELLATGPAGWLSLLGVLGLGLLATLPWGAVTGSLVRVGHGGAAPPRHAAGRLSGAGRR